MPAKRVKIGLAIVTGFISLMLGFVVGSRRETVSKPMSVLRQLVSPEAFAATRPAYTVEMVESLTSGPGAPVQRNAEVTGRTILARRADGATVSHYFHTGMRTHGGGSSRPSDEGTIIDPTCPCVRLKQNYLSATTTFRNTPEQLQPKLASATPESDCLLRPSGAPMYGAGARLVGRDRVLGYDTVVIETPQHAKYWMATALGCQLVRSRHTFVDKASGSLVTLNEQTATQIALGEPDPVLFAPIGDELKPSDAYRRKVALWGMNLDSSLERFGPQLAAVDQKYLEANKSAAK